MASGNTLVQLSPMGAEFPSSNYAALGLRNGHPVLQFDASSQETAYFRAVMPNHYSGNGVTVYVHWATASATSGTVGWDVAFERIGDGSQDLDSDGFASAQTISAVTVPGTSGLVDITSVSVSDGANMDNVAAGETFRLRIRRDVANDNAAGDAHLVAVHLVET